MGFMHMGNPYSNKNHAKLKRLNSNNMTKINFATRKIQFSFRRSSWPCLFDIRRLHYHSYDRPPPPGPFTDTQNKILSAALFHVPKYGFTNLSLARGANDMGYSDPSINLFPGGPFSLVHYYLYSQRLGLASARLGEYDPSTHQDHLSSPYILNKAKELTWIRLQGNNDIIHFWSEALALMAFQKNIPVALSELSALVDEIWFLAGEASVDIRWYSKRASLAAIYTSTEIFMTRDKSHNHNQTKSFLNRRFEEFFTIGSAIDNIGEWGHFTAIAALNILRSKGAPI